jgi:hypothetical protein
VQMPGLDNIIVVMHQVRADPPTLRVFARL